MRGGEGREGGGMEEEEVVRGCVEEEKVAYTGMWKEDICGPYQDS